MKTFDKWSNTFFKKLKVTNGIEDLRHVLHNFLGLVTHRQNIKKIRLRNEEESGESNSLGEYEIVQGDFTNLEISLNLLKCGQDVVLDTEVKSFLGLVTFSQERFGVFIDENELC
jgi:hypothetical protein